MVFEKNAKVRAVLKREKKLNAFFNSKLRASTKIRRATKCLKRLWGALAVNKCVTRDWINVRNDLFDAIHKYNLQMRGTWWMGNDSPAMYQKLWNERELLWDRYITCAGAIARKTNQDKALTIAWGAVYRRIRENPKQILKEPLQEQQVDNAWGYASSCDPELSRQLNDNVVSNLTTFIINPSSDTAT